jgi:hypothetical protein
LKWRAPRAQTSVARLTGNEQITVSPAPTFRIEVRDVLVEGDAISLRPIKRAGVASDAESGHPFHLLRNRDVPASRKNDRETTQHFHRVTSRKCGTRRKAQPASGIFVDAPCDIERSEPSRPRKGRAFS